MCKITKCVKLPYTPVYRSHACIRRTRGWRKILAKSPNSITHPIVCKKVLRKSQNNAALFDANPILTRSPRGPQIFFQYNMCENVSRRSITRTYRCIHNASCENGAPCVFAGQVWHQLIFPAVVSIGYSIYKAYVIRGIWNYV